MRISIKKILTSIMIILLLFHKQLENLTKIEAIGYSDEIVILILAICAIIKVFKNHRISKQTIFLLVLFVCYTVVGLLSYYINSSESLSQIDLIMTTFLETKFMILIISLLILDFTPNFYCFILKVLVAVANLCIIVAIVNLLFPEIYLNIFTWGFVQKRYGIISPCSIFDHPGTYGWYLVLIGSFFYFKWYENKSRNDLIRTLVYMIFGILSMKSKVFVAILVMVVTPLIFGKNNHSKIKKVLISLCLFFVLLLLFGESIWERLLLSFSSDYAETEARAALNINSIKLFVENFPIGVGFGKYGSWYARIRYSEYYYSLGMNYVYGLSESFMNFGTDTFWPCILGETGLIGLIAYSSFLGILIKQMSRFVKKRRNYVYLFCFFVLLQGIVESFAQSFFFGAPQNVICAFVVTMSFSIYKYSNVYKYDNDKNINI